MFVFMLYTLVHFGYNKDMKWNPFPSRTFGMRQKVGLGSDVDSHKDKILLDGLRLTARWVFDFLPDGVIC